MLEYIQTSIAHFETWLSGMPAWSAFLVKGGALTLATLIVAKVINQILLRITNRIKAIKFKMRPFPNFDKRLDKYIGMLGAAVRGIVWIFAAMVILEAWGVGTFSWLASDIGMAVVEKTITIAVIVGFRFVGWEISNGLE